MGRRILLRQVRVHDRPVLRIRPLRVRKQCHPMPGLPHSRLPQELPHSRLLQELPHNRRLRSVPARRRRHAAGCRQPGNRE